MKTTLSLAVLLLIGDASANQHRHHSRHRLNRQAKNKDNMYPPTAEGHEWWELDDHAERIHDSGLHHEDENSPYDPVVTDAPEDIKRVGNDHEPLHNAKLASEADGGYYNGFHHKDYQGNYVQNKLAQVKRRHGRHHDTSLLQTDSNVKNSGKYEHEDDTEDIPDGVDPLALVQRGTAMSRIEENQKWKKYYEDTASRVQRDREIDEQDWDARYAQEEEAKSFEFVQTGYDHEDDTEDIPDGFDPLALHRKRGDPFFAPSHAELVKQKEDLRLENQSNEVQAIMDQQEKEEGGPKIIQNVLLKDVTPHDDDTEDISLDQNPSTYDKHHSKLWNKQVNQQALAIEEDIRKQEAKEEAERAAIEAITEEKRQKKLEEEERIRKQNEAQEAAMKKQKAEEKKEREYSTKNKDVDLASIYSDMPAVDYLQTDVQGIYQHHSDFWEAQMDKAAQNLSVKMDRVEKDQEDDNNHHPTTDINELYNGIALQTKYDHHSDFWNAQMDNAAQKLEARIQRQEAEEEDEKYHKSMKTENMEKLYKFIALETGDDMHIYQHHSDFWDAQMNIAADKLQQKMDKVEKQQEDERADSKMHTINLNKLYNGIALQTGQDHSDAFYERVDELAAEEDKREQDEQKKIAQTLAEMNRNAIIQKEGMRVAAFPEIRHINPSLDYSDAWSELAEPKVENSRVQYNHENDTDDLVPEFSDGMIANIKIRSGFSNQRPDPNKK